MPRKKTPRITTLTKHRDLPASVGLVKEMRAELKSDISSLRHEMNSRFSSVDAKLDAMKADIHRIQVVVEEQRSENRIVLDAFKNTMERMDRHETEYHGRT